MASAGLYASLHLAPDRQPHQHATTLFFTGRMPFLPPNQQRQSTEGTSKDWRHHISHTHISRHQQMQPVTNRHVLSKCMIIWTSSITITAYCSSKSFWYSAQNSKQNTQIFNYQTTEEPMISLIQKTFLNASFCWLPQPKISNIIKYSFNIHRESKKNKTPNSCP